MRILLSSSLYKPHTGGIETMLSEMASHYIQMGHSVKILTKRWPQDLPEMESIEGVQVFRMLSARSEDEFAKLGRFLTGHLADLSCDVIHLVGARRPMPLVIWGLARKIHAPCMVTVAGGEIPHEGDAASRSVWNEGADTAHPFIPLFNHISACSRSLVNDLDVCLPGLSASVLYAGLDPERYRSIAGVTRQRPFIVTARRLVYDKGVDLLIRAFASLADSYPECDLVIIGDGPERPTLEQMASKTGLGPRIKFLGTLDFDRMVSYLKSALFTVVPSRSEGGGLVNTEAQSVGCPVIASRCGGIPEYTSPGKSALLFRTGDYRDLAEKMGHLLSNPRQRTLMGAEGIRFAECFSWENLAPEYINCYKDSITNYRGAITGDIPANAEILCRKCFEE